MLEAQAADEREARRNLEPVFERRSDRAQGLVDGIGFKDTVEPARRIERIDRILGESPRVLRERDLITVRMKLRGKAIVHAEHGRGPEEIEVVADHILIVPDEESIAVNGICRK